jgi:hypothetical protein
MHAFVISPLSRVHNEVRDVVARRWTVQIRHVFSSEFKTKFRPMSRGGKNVFVFCPAPYQDMRFVLTKSVLNVPNSKCWPVDFRGSLRSEEQFLGPRVIWNEREGVEFGGREDGASDIDNQSRRGGSSAIFKRDMYHPFNSHFVVACRHGADLQRLQINKRPILSLGNFGLAV